MSELEALKLALIEFYDFVQSELEAEPYRHPIGSYILNDVAAATANAVLVARDAARPHEPRLRAVE